MKRLLGVLLLAGCRIYDPVPADCLITCGAAGACPIDTVCRDGFCRTAGASGLCECRPGEERPCGNDQGSCVGGVQRCEGTQWGACRGEIAPVEERCNGLDDDCDGEVDEEISLPPACERTLGVCSEARQRCVRGAWRACEAASYGQGFEIDEVSCDGLDNDCDGLVDRLETVALASGVRHPWFFLTTASGFALISPGEARWFSPTFAPGAGLSLDAGTELLAASRGDTLILAERTDAGVLITSLETDGGSARRLVSTWLNPTALDLAGELAAASVDGNVQFLSLTDGGQPMDAGPDTDGTLRFSQSGQFLAWSGGLTRTSDLTLLRAGSVGPLRALIELESTVAGVPQVQPTQPIFFPDLLTSAASEPLAFFFTVPPLSGIEATEHLGRVLLVGIAAPSSLWMVNARGTSGTPLSPALDWVRLTPSHQPMAAVAWSSGGEVWAVRRCAP